MGVQPKLIADALRLRDARADENVCLYKRMRSNDSPFAFDRDARPSSEAQLQAMLPGFKCA